MNAFEKYQSLTNYIERMASTGTTGNTHEWSDFLFELNNVLTQLEARIQHED